MRCRKGYFFAERLALAPADTQTPTQEMNCPHCNQEIPNKDLAKHFASIGGKKSKRTITPEQQRRMQEAQRKWREAIQKRKEKRDGKEA